MAESGNLSNLERGTVVHQVTSVDLALCLMSCGVPLRRDPPFAHVKLANGESRWIFNFGPRTIDGKDRTETLVKAFKQGDAFIKANPEHPMTIAMCMLRNIPALEAAMSKKKAWIAFATSNASYDEILVKEGSKRHRMALLKGLVRVDPARMYKRRQT